MQGQAGNFSRVNNTGFNQIFKLAVSGIKTKIVFSFFDFIQDNRAVKSGINDAVIYLAMGYAYAAQDKNNEALKVYNKALELKPGDARIHFFLGALYEKLKQKDTAIKELREAIRLDPDLADAYNYLGYMFAEEGTNLDEAIALVKKALILEPSNGAYLDSLGWAYFQKGMLDEAIVELEKALKYESKDPVVRDHMGDAYFKKGLFDKARSEWKRSLELDPKQEKIREKLKK